MTSNYNHILLGSYSTKDMVESKDTNKINKRIERSLKFYQFRQKLIYKYLIKYCKFGLVDEFHTKKAVQFVLLLYKT